MGKVSEKVKAFEEKKHASAAVIEKASFRVGQLYQLVTHAKCFTFASRSTHYTYLYFHTHTCISILYPLIFIGIQNYVVFANGRPVIGEDNEPVCVPAGSRLVYPNVDRSVSNSTGALVIGESL